MVLAPNAGALGSISCQETRPHTLQLKKELKQKQKSLLISVQGWRSCQIPQNTRKNLIKIRAVLGSQILLLRHQTSICQKLPDVFE